MKVKASVAVVMPPPARSERLRFNLTLDKAAYEANKPDVDLVLNFFPVIRQDDKFTLNYEFSVEYFGEVADRLAAMTRILATPGLVADVGLSELLYGESVVARVFEELGALRRRLEVASGQQASD